MKYLVIALILLPLSLFAQIVEKNTPGPPADANNRNALHNFIMNKMNGIIICQSKTAISDPNHSLINCVKSSEFNTKSNLMELYDNGFRLIQVIKTEKGYLYYLEKK